MSRNEQIRFQAKLQDLCRFMGTIADQKAKWRAIALGRRDALTPSERRERSKSVASKLQAFLVDDAPVAEQRKRHSKRVLTLFSPIRSEVNLMPLAPILREKGWLIALPAIKANEIEFRRYEIGDELEKGAFGTQQPSNDKPILKPDVIVAPLAAFDRFGGRIGYGGGYYDRYVAAAAEVGRHPQFIGVAFECQRIDRVPMEGHDKVLDAIVTEESCMKIGTPK